MEQQHPIASLFDQLGRRWTLRVVWELRRDAIGFAELRRRIAISPSVLAQRLRELAEAGVIDRAGSGRYRLTVRGRELARILYELNRWAESAARESDLDAVADGREEAILGS